jgi:hypothetical protein
MALTNKSHPENSPEGKQAKADAQAADPSLAEVQKVADKEAAQGYRGVKTDPTPNENYTVAGVLAGAPTPETDKDHARFVRDHLLGVESQVDGVAGNGN